MSYIRPLIALILTASLAIAATPAIGVAVAKGSFQIDKSKVYGNTTLFDGSVIETSQASSDLVLNSGARLRLAADSLARIHSDRLVLEKGKVTGTSGFVIEALKLRVTPDSKDSQMTVAYNGASGIQVEALSGSARVSGPNGVLLASVHPGLAVDLDPQAAGAAAPTKLTGILDLKSGAFILPDGISRIVFELAGPTVSQFVGKCVEVTGTIDPGTKASAGAQSLVRVLNIKETTGCAPIGGMSTRSKVLIAGVAVGATAATVGVVQVTKDKKPKASRK